MIKINLTNEIYSKQKIQYARPVDKTIVEYISHWIFRNLNTKKLYYDKCPLVSSAKSFKYLRKFSEDRFVKFIIIKRITQILKPKGE